jgi:type I restriction enzyme, S subunit
MKAGWHKMRLAALTKKITDGSHNPPKGIAESDYLMLSSKNVFNDNLHYEAPRYLSPEQFYQEDKRTGILPGDILLTIVGTIGRCAVVPFDAPKITLQRSVAVIRTDREIIESRFLMYSFIERNEELNDQARGVAQKGIYLETLRELEVELPSVPEQQRIVDILDDAFDGIATAKANAEKNLQNARALFESHLHGVNAEKALLGDLVKITTGKLDANAAVEGGKFPFFTCSREIYAINDYAFDCEAILLAGNNAVGDFNVKHYKGKFNAYQRTYVITVNEQKRVLYRFLYFQMLKSLKKFKAQSVGAGTKFLKLGMIKEMEIELPSLAEQERIVSTMDTLREETQYLESLYQRKLAALDELKKSLLHQAFSGLL